jgi:elongation factor G
MMDAAAEGDDDLAMKYLEGEELTPEEIEHGLLVGVENGRVVPLLLGSAHTGIGVATLLDRIVGELPSPAEMPREMTHHHLAADAAGPLAAYVFKSTADPYVGRISYLRVFSGMLKADATVINSANDKDERVHHLFFPHGKNQEPALMIGAGDIGAVAKLNDVYTGDTLTTREQPIRIVPADFPEPIYRVAIRPVSKADEDKLGPALQRLLDEDPTLHYERDGATHQEILAGMGDIHIDTVIEKLRLKFGVSVQIEDARVPYRETVRGSAKAQGRHKRQTGGKGQFGDCWIELEPLETGAGFEFNNRVVGGAIPKNFIPAIEKGIREAMDRGLIAGYPVEDIRVTVYDGSYHDVDSNEAAFKAAGAIALRTAAEKANPVVLEPILDVEVDVPDDCVGEVVGDLNGRRGHLAGMAQSQIGKTRIKATVPMANMQRYALDLRSLTKGRGRFRQSITHYADVPFQVQQELVGQHATSREAD